MEKRSQTEELDELLVRILVRDFKITDLDKIATVVAK